ncbi:alpha-amylase family glycosyl hydrolase [Actinoplanes sichuanensis]|uniref:Alpha-amylase family glycosyl hydrolase n=1 Tax=Actinoplanes sichuanensis TaxID=512349 RepID=A0ABW4A4X3_9ACTN|nr:alpha-amylase family glycosyl hydrolase [Actinoplanes sichuanensis]BEL03211.1 alpha-amylase family glycosyl hydrolase [Actinoplanes sichuanensis]
MTVRRVADVNFAQLVDRDFHPSPAAWEDQVLYFLMLDRFSDGRERDYLDNDGEPVATGTTPPLRAADHGNAITTDADRARWAAAGADWAGGTLAGLRSKLGYLRRLGVTAIWISPVLRQVPGSDSYHGYGAQNFLDVDPHFGSADELRDLVSAAHRQGLRVILDVVVNHAGDVFGYDPDRYLTEQDGVSFFDPRWDGRPYRVEGFRDVGGKPLLPFGPVDDTAWPDGAVWPAELQQPGTFTARGRIVDWDHHPEFVEGDFFGLKDIALGTGPVDRYQPSPALRALTRVYQYWIAFADLDGFRVDTVKHMDPGAARYFASAIHEFAQSIGKDNFYLIAEITGDRGFAYRTLEQVGMDAALGIADVQDRLEGLIKGVRDPAEYFGLFRNSFEIGKDSATWFRNRVVTGYDDHDQVRKGDRKARFAADGDGGRLALAALALNAATLGIPCVYYGSEQGFDGAGGNDRYIREAMFGGDFGPFRSHGGHAFDENHPTYRQFARLLAMRRRMPALRRGRQYLREISGDGRNFGLPRVLGGRMSSVVPWSRILADDEVLAAVNTDPDRPRTAWVTVDAGLHAEGGAMTCRFSTDPTEEGRAVEVESRNGKAVEITVPAGGFVLYT